MHESSRRDRDPRATVYGISLGLALIGLGTVSAEAQVFTPGNLLVTTSTYAGDAGLITVGSTVLAGATAPQTVTATADGSYSQVFNNATTDPAFGVTSPITIEQLTPSGTLVSTISIAGAVTSFSSKSEMGLQPTADGTGLTFTGYVAPVNAIDVSNSNTAAFSDPTNPVTNSQFGGPYSRAIITLNADGTSSVTPFYAYSGNNAREAILANGYYYLVGNAGNSGSGPSVATLDSLSALTGAQLLAFGSAGTTTVDGELTSASLGHSTGDQYGFSVTQIGDAADKTGKDDNFRGEVIYDNTLYVTKGSGSNGVNTVYQVGTAGTLPTDSTASSTVISILPGFSRTLAKSSTGTIYAPFDLFFANATTLYVADEGGQTTNDEVGGTTYATNTGGLQKWIFNGSNWVLAYTLTNGLGLGEPFTVSGTVTDSTGSVTQYTDGLRHLAGVVSTDGSTATIYATTSTVGGLGDQGASPNQLVVITDSVASTTLPTGEAFSVLQTAAYGQVLRGVQFAPTVLPPAGATPKIAALATTLRSGQSTTLTATPAGSGTFTYQWYTGPAGNTSNPIAGATGASYSTGPLSSTTSYWVEITNTSTGVAGVVQVSAATTITVTAASTNVPLPWWALGALAAGLLGIAGARRRHNTAI